jgi:hypothetical protein
VTVLSQIITDAYRELNLIGKSETPTTEESTEAMRSLNRYIQGLFGNEAGDPLMDMLFGDNANVDSATYYNDFETFVKSWYLPAGFRLKLNLDQAETIKLTPNPENGARFGVVDASQNLGTFNFTLQGNGSRIENATSLTLDGSTGTSFEWFYRSDTANWHRITDLTEVDESPFPEEFDDLLVIGLAFRLDPKHGAGVNQFSINTYNQTLKKFRARYSQVQERAPDLALSRMDQRRQRRGYSLENEFERGSIFRR